MDLISSRPFWPVRDGLPATFPPLADHATSDVVIVGGGITGATLAWTLAEAGLDVVLLDRREAAHGSTAANTGLMIHELDVPLHLLAKRLGFEAAARAFHRCRAAVQSAERAVRRLRLDCGFRRQASLQLAATPRHVARLRREFDARRTAGLDVAWWPRRRLAAESSLPHAAAILTPDAAVVDPYRLTYGLLRAAQSAGARIHDRTTATRWVVRRSAVLVETSRGKRVRARRMVVAAGYESDAFLPRRTGGLRSTFALVSEPLPHFTGWPADGAMLWDTGDPYLYLRTTEDRRAIIGGGDEPFRGPHARDRQLAAKSAYLKARFRRFFPDMALEVATAWAGTFAITADGLPYIGEHPDVPHLWFALGFGGNGTCFSFIAAEILRDAMLGRTDPDAGLFGFARGQPGSSRKQR